MENTNNQPEAEAIPVGTPPKYQTSVASTLHAMTFSWVYGGPRQRPNDFFIGDENIREHKANLRPFTQEETQEIINACLINSSVLIQNYVPGSRIQFVLGAAPENRPVPLLESMYKDVPMSFLYEQSLNNIQAVGKKRTLVDAIPIDELPMALPVDGTSTIVDFPEVEFQNGNGDPMGEITQFFLRPNINYEPKTQSESLEQKAEDSGVYEQPPIPTEFKEHSIRVTLERVTNGDNEPSYRWTIDCFGSELDEAKLQSKIQAARDLVKAYPKLKPEQRNRIIRKTKEGQKHGGIGIFEQLLMLHKLDFDEEKVISMPRRVQVPVDEYLCVPNVKIPGTDHMSAPLPLPINVEYTEVDGKVTAACIRTEITLPVSFFENLDDIMTSYSEEQAKTELRLNRLMERTKITKLKNNKAKEKGKPKKPALTHAWVRLARERKLDLANGNRPPSQYNQDYVESFIQEPNTNALLSQQGSRVLLVGRELEDLRKIIMDIYPTNVALLNPQGEYIEEQFRSIPSSGKRYQEFDTLPLEVLTGSTLKRVGKYNVVIIPSLQDITTIGPLFCLKKSTNLVLPGGLLYAGLEWNKDQAETDFQAYIAGNYPPEDLAELSNIMPISDITPEEQATLALKVDANADIYRQGRITPEGVIRLRIAEALHSYQSLFETYKANDFVSLAKKTGFETPVVGKSNGDQVYLVMRKR